MKNNVIEWKTEWNVVNIFTSEKVNISLHTKKDRTFMLAKLKQLSAQNIQMENIIQQYKDLRNTIRFIAKIGKVLISAYQDLICVEKHSPLQYEEQQQVKFLKHFLCADVLRLTDISLIVIVDIGKIFIIIISKGKIDIHEKPTTIPYTRRCALNVIRQNDDNILLHLSFEQGHDSIVITFYRHSMRIETTHGYAKSHGLYFPIEGCFLNIQEHELTMYDGQINYMFSQPNTNRIQQVVKLDEYNYLGISDCKIFLMDYYRLSFNLVYETENIRWVFMIFDHLFILYQNNVIKYMPINQFSSQIHYCNGISLVKEELIKATQKLLQANIDPASKQFIAQMEQKLKLFEQKYGLTVYQINELEKWFTKFLQICNNSQFDSNQLYINKYFNYRKADIIERILPIEDIDSVYLPFIITQNDYYKQVYQIHM